MDEGVDSDGLTESAGSGVVAGVRIAHDTATVDDIESAYHSDQTETVTQIIANEDVAEAFALQTCRRVEAYVVADTASAGRRVLTDFAPDVDSHVVVEMDHEESLVHLMRVAAGLESVILGEDRILGQVRDAYADARDVDAIGPVLDSAVLKAIHVGERARAETAINDGVCSIGSATVALAADYCDLDGATALVVGAGQVGSLVATALTDADIETLYIANRSVARAERVAADVDLADARAVGLDALPSAVATADVIVSATSSDEYILDADHLDGCGDTLVLDYARPRDVSPAADAIDEVTVLGLDALESVIDESKQRRRNAVGAVEAIVDREFARLQGRYKRERADEVIAAMYQRAEEIKACEVSTALSRLEARGEVSDAQREIVTSLADAVVSHLLADPTTRLREAAGEGDWTTLETACQVFVPDVDVEAVSARVPDD